MPNIATCSCFECKSWNVYGPQSTPAKTDRLKMKNMHKLQCAAKFLSKNIKTLEEAITAPKCLKLQCFLSTHPVLVQQNFRSPTNHTDKKGLWETSHASLWLSTCWKYCVCVCPHTEVNVTRIYKYHIDFAAGTYVSYSTPELLWAAPLETMCKILYDGWVKQIRRSKKS